MCKHLTFTPAFFPFPSSWECINVGLDWNTGLGNAHVYWESGQRRTLEDLPLCNAHSDCPLQVFILILYPCTPFQTRYTCMERLVREWRALVRTTLSQSGHYTMASLPVFSADHFLNKHVLIEKVVCRAYPVLQSSVYILPFLLPQEPQLTSGHHIFRCSSVWTPPGWRAVTVTLAPSSRLLSSRVNMTWASLLIAYALSPL